LIDRTSNEQEKEMATATAPVELRVLEPAQRFVSQCGTCTYNLVNGKYQRVGHGNCTGTCKCPATLDLIEAVVLLLAGEACVLQAGTVTANCNESGTFKFSSLALIPIAEQIQREGRAFWKGLSMGLAILSLVLLGGLVYALFFR
jgi:hypothetical protein